MRNRRRVVCCILAITFLVMLSGCAKTYYLQSQGVYLPNGQELKGKSIDRSRVSLFISDGIKDMSEIQLTYFNTVYCGTYYGGFVIWDKDPYLVDGYSILYSKIWKSNGMIVLECTYYDFYVKMEFK